MEFREDGGRLGHWRTLTRGPGTLMHTRKGIRRKGGRGVLGRQGNMTRSIKIHPKDVRQQGEGES